MRILNWFGSEIEDIFDRKLNKAIDIENDDKAMSVITWGLGSEKYKVITDVAKAFSADHEHTVLSLYGSLLIMIYIEKLRKVYNLELINF